MDGRSVANEGFVAVARRTRFVLVQPRSAGNVGSAARALKNLGFARLMLVRPACDPLDPDARRMAVGAADLLERTTVHDCLDAALQGVRTVVGTSARKGRQRQPHWSMDRLSEELVRLAALGELAFLFGREDSGLTDLELDHSTHLVHLPAEAGFSSFNLAQAVLLVAYELRRAAYSSVPVPPEPPPADHAAREAMYRHLETALLAIGFISEQTGESIMRRLRRLFGRARLDDQGVQLLRGLARQIVWAAEQAGLVAGKVGRPGNTGRNEP